jgi:hypothetical protein
MSHWKHAATRCAVDGCERTRRKGWTTCSLIGHAERGVSLYGLAPKAPRLRDPDPLMTAKLARLRGDESDVRVGR